MKFKVCIVGLLFIVIVAFAINIPSQDVEYDYLRLHIRANSNSEIDQNIKYEIKDLMIDFLSPILCEVKSKQQAIDIINNNKNDIKNKCLSLLRKRGFYYSVNIKINNEYFPTRTYSNTTLESGYYDAVIVELGSAEGDNWWCVMYPPLCFVNKNEEMQQIKYKSRVFEWFESLFN